MRVIVDFNDGRVDSAAAAAADAAVQPAAVAQAALVEGGATVVLGQLVAVAQQGLKIDFTVVHS